MGIPVEFPQEWKLQASNNMTTSTTANLDTQYDIRQETDRTHLTATKQVLYHLDCSIGQTTDSNRDTQRDRLTSKHTDDRQKDLFNTLYRTPVLRQQTAIETERDRLTSKHTDDRQKDLFNTLYRTPALRQQTAIETHRETDSPASILTTDRRIFSTLCTGLQRSELDS